MLRRRGDRGAALVEFYIVALFALLPFTMAILQTAILLSAKNVVNHATFMAARAGAVENASRSRMLAALARGLMPLHAAHAGDIESRELAAVATQAYARAYADVLLFARLHIVSPSVAAFDDFGEQFEGAEVIRNDSLEYRDTDKGTHSGQSIQEANILDIRVSYCQPLVFPLIDRLLVTLLQQIDASPNHQLCYAARRVPISARGIVHMQSDARRDAV